MSLLANSGQGIYKSPNFCSVFAYPLSLIAPKWPKGTLIVTLHIDLASESGRVSFRCGDDENANDADARKQVAERLGKEVCTALDDIGFPTTVVSA